MTPQGKLPGARALFPLAVAAILLVTTLCYLPVLTHQWVNWDDPWLVSANPLLHRFEGETVRRIFTDFSQATRYTLGAEYLPLRDLSVMLDLRLWGDWAGGFLLTNLLLYLGSLTALAALMRRLTRDDRISLICLAVYALHPVHVESVAWASARKDVLCLLFFFLSLLTLERFFESRRRWLLISLAFYLAALASKYLAVVLPLFVLLRLWWRSMEKEKGSGFTRAAGVLLSYTAVTAVFFVPLSQVARMMEMTGDSLAPEKSVLVLTMGHVFLRYFFNLLLPLRLAPDYAVEPVRSLLSPEGAASLTVAVLLLILAAALLLRLRRGNAAGRRGAMQALVWLFWFFGGLLPTSQILGLQNQMADRYLLFSSWSYAMLAAGFFAVGLAGSPWLRRASVLFLAGMLLFLALLTFRQVGVWQDSLSLWSRTVAVEPFSQKGWYQLAVSQRELERRNEERRALERLLELNPLHEQGLNNYAINLYEGGADPQAVAAVYGRLLDVNPASVKAWHNYGYVLIDLGRMTEAGRAIEEALRLDPDYCLAWNGLGRLRLREGDLEAARELFSRALDCDPDLEPARRNLEGLGEAGGE